jgi:hypothetical protein
MGNGLSESSYFCCCSRKPSFTTILKSVTRKISICKEICPLGSQLKAESPELKVDILNLRL